MVAQSQISWDLCYAVIVDKLTLMLDMNLLNLSYSLLIWKASSLV